MIDIDYSIVIEATRDPNYFGFYSPELKGFTGIGNSIEDSLYKAKWGMKEHVEMLKKQGLSVPPKNPRAVILISNESELEAIPNELLKVNK